MDDEYFSNALEAINESHSVELAMIHLRNVALEAQRNQAVADCKAVCKLCRDGEPVCKDEPDFHFEGDDVVYCEAQGIRQKWRATHNGEPLEVK